MQHADMFSYYLRENINNACSQTEAFHSYMNRNKWKCKWTNNNKGWAGLNNLFLLYMKSMFMLIHNL